MKVVTYIKRGELVLMYKRQTWGELNPVTRKPENSKSYNRKKSQNWKRELPLTSL